MALCRYTCYALFLDVKLGGEMSELVSVIIPSYNHEKFIQSVLLSIYNQSYKDIELIVVDDCSKDKTYEIAYKLCSDRRFKSRFKNLIVKRNEQNVGAHANINKGISLSSGDFIAIVNSDDLYHISRIEKLVNKFKENEKSYFFAFTNYAFIDENGQFLDSHPLYVKLQYILKNDIFQLPHPWFIFLQTNIGLSTGNFFFSRKLFETVGKFMNLKYCHDFDFVLQSLRYTDLVFIDEPLYYYRIHSANTFSSVYDLRFVETEIVLTRYFRTVEFEEVINLNAPCRRNYPLLFEFYIKKFYLDSYYKKALIGYSPVHRVVNKEIFRRISPSEEE